MEIIVEVYLLLNLLALAVIASLRDAMFQAWINVEIRFPTEKSIAILTKFLRARNPQKL